MQTIFYIILIAYAYQIIRYKIGWSLIKPLEKKTYRPTVSVIVALRNEEKNINNLLEFLKNQNYNDKILEFILVNDHSSDNTLSLLHKSNIENLRIINLNDDEYGKKTAIMKAVNIANGEIILATDADCSFDINWVSSMISYFQNPDVHLVSGPVIYHKKNSFFQKIQCLEFVSLVASAAGSVGINNAIFCNGANMAYRKKSFLKLNDFNIEII